MQGCCPRSLRSPGPSPEMMTMNWNTQRNARGTQWNTRILVPQASDVFWLYCWIYMNDYSGLRPRRCYLHAPLLPRHPTVRASRSPRTQCACHNLLPVCAIPQTRMSRVHPPLQLRMRKTAAWTKHASGMLHYMTPATEWALIQLTEKQTRETRSIAEPGLSNKGSNQFCKGRTGIQ